MVFNSAASSCRKIPFIFTLALTVFLASACSTRQEVQEIVAQSNAKLLMAQLPGGTLPSGELNAPNDAPWVELSGRLDAFIAAHPDQAKIANAMRVRQAMLLLAYNQINLAQASFNMVNPNNLKDLTARDQALYNVRDSLLWWFGLDKRGSMSRGQFEKADKTLSNLQTQVDQLESSPGIRDYIAEIRVWIALYSGLKITTTAKTQAYVEDGINQYAQIFTSEDLAALHAPTNLTNWQHSAEVVRRRLRARAIIKYAREVIRSENITPLLTSKATQLLGQ